MANLVLSMFTSLDGYIAGPGGQFIGPAWSDDLERHWSGYALERAGHLLYGRINFEFNKGFWTSDQAAGISYAPTMNRLPKTVVSRTLAADPGWNGRVAGPDLAATVRELKAASDKDIYCFGGAGIANSLVQLDLVDEYRIMVTPDIFGGGIRLFEPGLPRLTLQRLDALALDTGATILHYRRARG